MARPAEAYESTESAVRTSGGWLQVHGLPLSAPGICCALFALVVIGAHRAGGGDPILTPLVAIAALVIGGLLTWFALLGAGPRPLLRILVTVTGALATGNLVIGLVVGLRSWLWGYLVSSLIVWTLWVIWRGLKYTGAGGAAASGNGAEGLFRAITDAKAAFGTPKVDDRGVVTASVRTLPGGTIADVQHLLPAISAHARAVRGGTTLAQHPITDGVGTLKVPTKDNLAERIPFPGVAGLPVGALPTTPFPIGERQTGPVMIQIVGDYERDRTAHDFQPFKIGGTTRSGKSTGGRTILAPLMVMRRLNVIGLDFAKDLQTFGPLAPGMWPIVDPDEGRLFMHRIGPVIRGRTRQLASEGLMRWTPRSRLNALVVWTEESKALRALMRQYTDMVADAGSAGIWVVSSTQRWLHRSMSTDVRALSGAAAMFGVEEYADAAAILPQEALQAIGQNLQLWGASKPGRAYLTGLGIPRNLWGDEVRFYDPLDEQLAEVVEVGAAYRDPMDDITAELFGELYAQRTIYTAAPTAAASGRAAVPTATAGWSGGAGGPRRERIVVAPRPGSAYPHDLDDDKDEADEADPGEEMETMATAADEHEQDRQELFDELGESLRRHLGDDATSGDLADVDPDAKINDDLAGLIADADAQEPHADEATGSRPTPAEAQRIFDTKLHELYVGGQRRIVTSDLTAWLALVRRERTFVYRQIDRWCEGGFIVPVPGPDDDGWDLVRSPLEPQGPPHGA